MHVFITGATGLIGSAVTAELLSHGHTVLALARSDASARAAEAAGASTIRGGLGDLEALRAGTEQAEAAIHLAFGNDFSTAEAMARSAAEEGAAVKAIGDVLRGTDRPFVTVSGTPMVAGRASTEHDALVVEGPLAARGQSVAAVLALATDGVRSSAVRMPRTVHNNGEGGFAGLLTAIARQKRLSGYPGDGMQRWPAVHARDAAVLFRLALERAEPGTIWHAVADEGDHVRDIAAVIGRRLGVPVEQVPTEAFGPLGPIFSMDQPSTSAITRQALGWEPTHPSLLADLENIQP